MKSGSVCRNVTTYPIGPANRTAWIVSPRPSPSTRPTCRSVPALSSSTVTALDDGVIRGTTGTGRGPGLTVSTGGEPGATEEPDAGADPEPDVEPDGGADPDPDE